ncbi:porphyrin biosynthesis protein HemD [Arthrobacter crystallopoietes BAB-32]|uniref:uroporphyrinogen-III C-methyltransferase n=1 Tax=Arthrobacter crystallopoietes BAB-32 TaxID=1246476 RepID=N1V3Z8_9MICC|nr:uroporphyrinogen-III C-methyltransferase [Arthrobacter crystallopoietes]EMY36085.1 porphyrin biosynthesis protein HemD [Arthrobacter crystallopoietes BAB-32]
MQLTADLTGRHVLVAGARDEARRVVRRYRAAGAVLRTVSRPDHFTPDLLNGAVLAVVVSADDGGWPALAQACGAHGVLLAREAPAAPGGRVTLVGGGPGTEDLLTVGAQQALREADVVLFDRLAPHRNLSTLAPGAELVDVGKQPGHHQVAQRDIERLMVEAAQAGNNVVRLKGGDPFVFGRGGEEVAACAAAGIPVSVVPGVTSAVSVPAAAGIPVTHRGVSHLFTVVSGHQPLSDAEHVHLAGLGGTVVVLMGIGTLPQLIAGLRRAGMRPDMPVAVVERGYSDSQRTTVSTLAGIVTAAGAARVKSPAILVIGEVVRLAAGCEAGAGRLADLAEAVGA